MHPNTNFVFAGLIAVFCSWALSGCRFGNDVEESPVKVTSISGFYMMESKSIRMCVYAPNERCITQDPMVGAPPDGWSYVLSNPIGLSVPDAGGGKGSLISTTDTDYGLNFNNTGGGGFNLSQQTNPYQYWHNSDTCGAWEEWIGNGSYTTWENQGSFNDYPISGRVSLGYTVRRYIDDSPDCQVAMSEVRQCYLDSTKCRQTSGQANQEEQAFWVEHFRPYISAGLMGAADIPNFRTVTYTIDYR